MRIGLVTNAASERNRNDPEALAAIVRSAPEIVERRFDGSRSFADILAELAAADVSLLVTNGGDGTVQGVLTALLEDRPFATPPPLAILPRGMANMTAADVGLLDRKPATLARLIEAARAGRIEEHLLERRVLRIANIADATPQCGMFFGAAGIYDAIAICKGKVHRLGLKGEASHAVTLAGLLTVAALRGLDAAGIHGRSIGVGYDGAPLATRRRLLVLATTLDKLVLGSRPFWNETTGPVRFTSIADPPDRLLRHARRILYGGPMRDLPPESYESRGAGRVTLALDGPFTIDGQFFTASAARLLEITATDPIRFVRL